MIAAPLIAAALASTPVGIGESEWQIDVYRPAIRAGTVRFNVSNDGEDTHDLQVVDPTGRAVAQSPDVRSGDRFTLRARLRRPGTYVLLCTKPGHAALGMRATLRVKRAQH